MSQRSVSSLRPGEIRVEDLWRRYRLTREIFEVLLEARNPCSILTKSPLLLRDLDVFLELAKVTERPVSKDELQKAIEALDDEPATAVTGVPDASDQQRQA